MILPLLLALSMLAFNALPAMAEHGGGQPAAGAANPDEFGLDFSQIDPNAPDLDYVWQDSYTAGEVYYNGFLRLRARPGYVWQRGHFSNGHWVPPHWVPTRNRVDFIWVPGHRGADSYWTFGHWRRLGRPGFIWVERRTVNTFFTAGYWKPLHPRAGHYWVHGHPAPSGVWVSGFWRPRARAGFVWAGGRYRYGRWTRGHWKPAGRRAGFIWAAGYYGPGSAWVPGYWRPLQRSGYYWYSGHWKRNLWVRGRWLGGRRPRVNRHHRVYRPHAIRAHRRGRARHVYRPQKRKVQKHRRKDKRRQGRRRHR